MSVLWAREPNPSSKCQVCCERNSGCADMDLEGFGKEERDEPFMMAMEVVSKFGLGEMLTTLLAYYYPRVVKLFYQQLGRMRQERKFIVLTLMGSLMTLHAKIL